MDHRWQQRRAAVNARRAEVTSSVVLERSEIVGAKQASPVAKPLTAVSPPSELVLEDMRQLELKDAAVSGGRASHSHAAQNTGAGSIWLRDTQRAMLTVAALSCSVLLALLYFGGFLG